MKKYFFIGIFGFLGAISRYYIKTHGFHFYNGLFPINTIFINLLGAFIIAFFLTAAVRTQFISEEWRLGIATGFLGAFTTFSTLCKESVLLLLSGHIDVFFQYTVLSVVLGLFVVYLGNASFNLIYSYSYKATNAERKDA